MNGLRSDQTATLVESCLDDIGAAAEEMIAVTDGKKNFSDVEPWSGISRNTTVFFTY